MLPAPRLVSGARLARKSRFDGSTRWPVFVWLVAFACASEAPLGDSEQDGSSGAELDDAASLSDSSEPEPTTTSGSELDLVECSGLEMVSDTNLPAFGVPVRVHLTRSTLRGQYLCEVLQEVNELYFRQASVCFEFDVVADDRVAKTGLDLWFERTAPFPNGVEANGVYGGPHEIFVLDSPVLANAANPSRTPAARTAAHELGHALGLSHQNCGGECLGLLMTSGTRGTVLSRGAPADVDEIATLRAGAEGADAASRQLGSSERCPAPRVPM